MELVEVFELGPCGPNSPAAAIAGLGRDTDVGRGPRARSSNRAAGAAAIAGVRRLVEDHLLNLPLLITTRSFLPASIVEPGILNVHFSPVQSP